MSPTPDQPSPSIDSLQFEKAEIQPVGRKCTLCAGLTGDEYYQFGGADTCAACAEQVRVGQARPASGQVMRGILFGVVVAIVSSLLYGLVGYVTGMEFAILSILVGFAVGTAIRMGSGGMGGKRCQWAAVLLTFVAIAGGSVPVVFQQMTEARTKMEIQAREAKAQGKATFKDGEHEVSVNLPERDALARFLYAFVFSMFLPFFGLFAGFSGLLGMAILAFGLHRAWKLTARDQRLLVGPLRDEAPLASV